MMKFITEEYLRDLYRKEPFNTYKLQQGQRLTPGAAQYLSDKRIKISDNKPKNKNNASKNNMKFNEIEDKQIENNETEIVKKSEKSSLDLQKRFCYKLKAIESEILIISSEILKEDIFLAQNIINLGKKISNIRNFISGKGPLEVIICKECTGIKLSDFASELEDCFEITEFHIQLKNSNSILKMHTLRCKLQELKFELAEIHENDDTRNEIMRNLNSIINSLSQLICSAVGGKECQRKE